MIHTPSQNVLAKNSFCTPITAVVTNGTGVDCLGFRRALATFTSAPSGAGTTSDCKLQEAADNATWADVTSATFTQVTTVTGLKIETMDINLAKRLRYLRLVHTGVGAAAAGAAVGTLLLFEAFDSVTVAQDVTAVSV